MTVDPKVIGATLLIMVLVGYLLAEWSENEYAHKKVKQDRKRNSKKNRTSRRPAKGQRVHKVSKNIRGKASTYKAKRSPKRMEKK